ncbi:hypothetical protein RUM43_009001 [Polyplax serrata]|uniref:Uncharacterized protein n=1 Tax=Polyplax serrata TaxID=468196 RepID=A0AAN8RU44_POLSC
MTNRVTEMRQKKNNNKRAPGQVKHKSIAEMIVVTDDRQPSEMNRSQIRVRSRSNFSISIEIESALDSINAVPPISVPGDDDGPPASEIGRRGPYEPGGNDDFLIDLIGGERQPP